MMNRTCRHCGTWASSDTCEAVIVVVTPKSRAHYRSKSIAYCNQDTSVCIPCTVWTCTLLGSSRGEGQAADDDDDD